MDQAYQSFNSGKYKEALTTLNSNPCNLDSYEPNLAICEYMANRCQQSALNCIRKLNELLARKWKRDQSTLQPHTHNIVKFNIAILLILQGRRDSAILLLQDVYQHRDCFIEFMQSRLMVLLMELNNHVKNPIETLSLHRYYLLRPTDHRQQANQWASIIFHQHGKVVVVAREEFLLMTRIYLNQALIQLGAPAGALFQREDDEKLVEQLVAKARRRKNALNKYYQINLLLVSRFHQALRSLYHNNYQRCLQLMNFATIVEDLEQMPTTKIITNIISAFVSNNAAIAHLHQGTPTVALSYLVKAKTLLAKACTGVEDKDLHLFSLNYGSHIDTITFNQALILLAAVQKDRAHPQQENNYCKQSYLYFETLRKSGQMSRNYKFWYRMAQSVLQYYHDPKVPQNQKQSLLSNALNSLTNALLCLDQYTVPTHQQLKSVTDFTNIEEEQIEGIILKLKAEALRFRHSILTLICYVSLGLGLYRRVVRVAQTLLDDKKLDPLNKLNVIHYLIEALNILGKNTLHMRHYLDLLQFETKQVERETQVLYVTRQGERIEKSDYTTLFYHQVMKLGLQEGRLQQAMNACIFMRQKNPTSRSQFMADTVKAIQLKCNLDKKFLWPFVKVS